MKSAQIAASLICLAACLFAAPRHKVTPSFELLPGELDLRSTYSRERWQGAPKPVPPLFLPDGRIVVAAADSVYMLSPEGEQLWKYVNGQGEDPETGEVFGEGVAVVDIAFNAARDELALVCEENVTVRLDAATGKVKYANSANGPGEYLGVIAYGKGYLWRSDNGGGSGSLAYEEEAELGFDTPPNWVFDIPPNAEIVVNGDKIYCLERSYSKKRGRYRVLLREFHPSLSLLYEPRLPNREIERALDEAGSLSLQLRYQEAIVIFDQVIQQYLGVAAAYYERGRVYYDLGQYGRAIQDYDEAIRLEPNDPRTYFHRAQAHEGLDQYERAIEDYGEAIRVAPEDAFHSYLARGDAYRVLGRDAPAISDYSMAIRLAFSDAYATPKAYAHRAEIYFDLGEYERAIADYDQAISFEPDVNPDVWELRRKRALAYKELKKNVRQNLGARRHKVTSKLELLPGELDLHSTRPRAYSDEVPKAIPPLILPDHRMVVVAADTVYMLTADGKQLWRYATGERTPPDEAPVGEGSMIIQIAFSAVRNELALIGEDHLTVFLNATTGKVKDQSQPNGPVADDLDVLAYRKGYLWRTNPATGSHPQDYLAYYQNPSECGTPPLWDIGLPDDGAEIFVNGDRIFYLRRSNSKKSGRYRILFRQFHPPLTQDSDDCAAETDSRADAGAALERGQGYLLAGKKKRAFQEFDKAIRLSPEEAADAYLARGDAYSDLGEDTRAIPEYGKAIRLASGPIPAAEAYTKRAQTYFDLGQYERAIADYDQAIGFEPDSETYYNRGLAYEKLKQKARAQQDFDRAKKLGPGKPKNWD